MLNKVSDLDDIRKFEVEEIMELVAKAEMLGLHEAKFSKSHTS
jgi:phenylalanine-4-hydroxylase